MASSKAPLWEYFSVTKPADLVAHVEINRPSRLNSFIEPMWLELRKVFDALSVDPDVRSIVLSGSGDRAFTTGLDVQAAQQSSVLFGSTSQDTARRAAAIRRHILDFQECITSVERCEKPVICALHGHALGLAIDLSTAADVRVCARGTEFAVKEVDIGLAADVGTLTRLPKVVGNHSWVKDVCLSARIFGAEEAKQVGFVSGVYNNKEEALNAALKWASSVAEKSPVAVQGTKHLLDYSRDHSVEDGLNYTATWNSAALQTMDTSAAMMATMAKRKPTFEKL